MTPWKTREGRIVAAASEERRPKGGEEKVVGDKRRRRDPEQGDAQREWTVVELSPAAETVAVGACASWGFCFLVLDTRGSKNARLTD
ncbi:hypothetical protein QYE76_064063 [Lolium multiflorum]|uniref:Uncharacterized protein n=1 Tax=Lolium multiflorum TaxID=4521 RepID=A0AAD8S7L8_LOLMU|nr:hypothetical protein QYE76_064063 [Lolium multiflorum]